MEVSIYQDTIIVDQSVGLPSDGSDVLRQPIPAAASSLSVVSVEPTIQLKSVRVEPAQVVARLYQNGTEVDTVSGLLLSSSDSLVRMTGETKQFRFQWPSYVIEQGSDSQMVVCQFSRKNKEKALSLSPFRVSYRLPAANWQFQHDMMLWIDAKKAVLTSSIRLETTSLPSGEASKIVFAAKRLGSPEEANVEETVSYEPRAKRAFRHGGGGEAMAAPSPSRGGESVSVENIESDVFGSWTIPATKLVRYETNLFPVSLYNLGDVNYRLIHVSNAQEGSCPPVAYLEFMGAKLREQLAHLERGRLILRAAPGHLISDALMLGPTSERINLGPFQAVQIQERLVLESPVERWKEHELIITNKSGEKLPVLLEVWKRGATKVMVRIDETHYGNPLAPIVDPIDKQNVIPFTVPLDAKRNITTAYFRWYYI